MKRAAILVTMAACRGGAPAAPAEPAQEFLIWSAGGEEPETRWVDAAGAERGRARGILIAAGDTVWQLERTTRTLATGGCRLGDEPRTEGTAELTDLAAVSA